jgi:signal transduction histidine kinase
MQHEIERLSNDFLTIASHELLTPLTAILGNIQLAQRRLEMVKHQLSKQVSQKIKHVEQPLASASQSAWLQKRIINDMIDYARLETKQYHLLMNLCDLDTLLKEAITSQQRAVPERTIVLSLPSTEQGVPIFANAERITEVFNAYLAHALKDSPMESPVTVQVAVTDAEATVLVHHERPAIPQDVQELLGERFPYARESAMQQDLSFGSGFSLCRAFIEAHHGRIGVESDPGHGETFWFTLPLAASARGGKA